MYCPQCGSQMKDDARFCAQCGTSLAPPQPTQRPAAPQAMPAAPDATAGAVQEPAATPDVARTAVYDPAAAAPTMVQDPVVGPADDARRPSDAAPQPTAVDGPTPTMPIPSAQPGAMPTMPIPNGRTEQSPAGPESPAPGAAPADQPGSAQARPGSAQAQPVSAQPGSMPTGPIPPVQAGQAPASAGPVPPTQGPTPPAQPGMQPGQPTQPGQPGQQPGFGASPTMQAIRSNATVRELTAPNVLRTAGVSLGIGLASALVLAVLAAAILTAGGTTAMDEAMYSSGMGGMLGGLDGILTGPNFFQILVFALIAGVSGSFSLSMSASGLSLDSMASMSVSLPVGLSGVALLVGAAFGAYLFARRLAVRFKWTGAVSAAGVGVAAGLVYVILGAIFPISVSASYGGDGAGAALNGASFRTFAMAFVLAGLGALAGYFLAQFAPDSSNVFLAAWRWTHRARGFVRTVVESAAIYAVVFAAASLVTLVVSAAMAKSAAPLMLIPFAFPFLPIAEFTLGALGAVSFTVTGQQTTNLSVFAPNLGDSLWMYVLLVVVFVVTTLYIALRLAARNIYDRAYAGWQHSWKSPVAAAVTWVLVPFCVAGITANVSAFGSGSGAIGVAPALWFFLVAAVWAFLVEAAALTFGPTLVSAMPGLWRLFVGGTVQPTPQGVTDYVVACGATFGRPAGPQTPAGPQPTADGMAGTAAGMAAAGVAGAAAAGAAGAAMAQPTAAAAGQPAAPSPVGPDDAATTGQTGDPDGDAAVGDATPADGRPGDGAPTTVIPPAAVPPTGGEAPKSFGAAGYQPGPTTPSGPGAPNGYAAAAAVPPVVPVAPAPRKPMTAKQKLTLIVIGVVAAVAVALGVAYAALNATVFSPSHVADEYLSAIASGSYDRANEIADPQIDQSQRALLTDAAAQAENATIANARVVSIDDATDGSKTVTVSYTIGGNTVNDTFTMASTGSQFLVFPDWTVTTPLLKQIEVSTSSAITELEINGVTVSADNASSADDYSMSFRVYPGTYRVSAAASDYITSDTATLDTDMQSYGYLTAEATDALTAEIQSAVDERLQTCVASTDAEPDGCPFGRYVYSSDRYRNFSWSITTSPTVDYISLDSGSFSTDYGEATVTYEYQNYDETWEPDDYTDSFSVYGDFVIDGDTVTVTFDEDYW